MLSIEKIVATLHTWALAVGFWGVFGFAFLEEIFPPLPSTAVAMSLGFLLFAGQPLSWGMMGQLFVRVGVPMAFGLTLGALVIYYIVRWGGIVLIDRWGKWIGVSNADIEVLRGRMKGSRIDDVLFFIARAFPLAPSIAINILAALVRWDVKSFIVLTFGGTIIRAVLSALIGWQVGNAFQEYAATIEKLQLWIFALCVLGGAIFFWYRRKRAQKNTITNHQPPTSNP